MYPYLTISTCKVQTHKRYGKLGMDNWATHLIVCNECEQYFENASFLVIQSAAIIFASTN